MPIRSLHAKEKLHLHLGHHPAPDTVDQGEEDSVCINRSDNRLHSAERRDVEHAVRFRVRIILKMLLSALEDVLPNGEGAGRLLAGLRLFTFVCCQPLLRVEVGVVLG